MYATNAHPHECEKRRTHTARRKDEKVVNLGEDHQVISIKRSEHGQRPHLSSLLSGDVHLNIYSFFTEICGE